MFRSTQVDVPYYERNKCIGSASTHLADAINSRRTERDGGRKGVTGRPLYDTGGDKLTDGVPRVASRVPGGGGRHLNDLLVNLPSTDSGRCCETLPLFCWSSMYISLAAEHEDHTKKQVTTELH